jgi:hypothetical protein
MSGHRRAEPVGQNVMRFNPRDSHGPSEKRPAVPAGPTCSRLAGNNSALCRESCPASYVHHDKGESPAGSRQEEIREQ